MTGRYDRGCGSWRRNGVGLGIGLHLLLLREGGVLNRKKLYRLYKEEKLTVRKRGGRKRALGNRAPMRWPGSFSASTPPRSRSGLARPWRTT